MYTFLLAFHNIVRWVALFLGIFVTASGLFGWFGKRTWTQTNRRMAVFYTSAMDIQILIGLLLYIFFSPITQSAFQNFSAAMSSPELRFFALEHTFYMLLAVVFAHLGSVFARKAEQDSVKFRRSAIWFGLSLLLLLLGMPWGRPIFPAF
jgi:uncharacterized membrane protein